MVTERFRRIGFVLCCCLVVSISGPISGAAHRLRLAIGGELIGSTGGDSIVEIVAGVQFVGDGVFDLLSSPVESFEPVSGFDFRLPMLEGMTGAFTEGGPDEAGDGSSGDGEDRDDGRFEMLRC